MCLISYIIYDQSFGRHPFKDNGKPNKFTNVLLYPSYKELCNGTTVGLEMIKPYTCEELEITSFDNLKLKAYYYKCPKPTHNTAILIHGYNSGPFKDCVKTGAECLKHGYNILLVANRACDTSEGKWAGFGNLESRDCIGWINKLIEMDKDVHIFCQGTSLGGATICNLSGYDLPSNVKCFISDCAFTTIRDEVGFTMSKLIGFTDKFLVNIMNGWNKKLAKYSMDDVNPITSVTKTTKPILFIHGEMDNFIPLDCCKALYNACASKDKEMYISPNAGHAASYAVNPEEYYEKYFAFVEKHI